MWNWQVARNAGRIYDKNSDEDGGQSFDGTAV